MDLSDDVSLVLELAAAWTAVERRVSASLAAIRGISLAEYRLLAALAAAPGARSSRVDLARAVGLTPSAVTRALRPLEELGMVDTVKHERDARQALATLTPAGRDLVADATEVLADTVADVLVAAPRVAAQRAELRALLAELARA
jgi:DNA-binding MarR family transcriptional regulator